MVSFSIETSPSMALTRESRVVREWYDRAEPLDILLVSVIETFFFIFGLPGSGGVSARWKGKMCAKGPSSCALLPRDGLRGRNEKSSSPFKVVPATECRSDKLAANLTGRYLGGVWLPSEKLSTSALKDLSGSSIPCIVARSPDFVACHNALFRRLALRRPPESVVRYERTASKVLSA